MPCGVGTKTRTKKCVDKAHNDKELDKMECINEASKPWLEQFYKQEEKCDMGGCKGKQFKKLIKTKFPSF